MTQTALLCGCGSLLPTDDAGECLRCRRRQRLNREKFAGLREAVLRRDDGCCRACGSPEAARLVVHHRQPGKNALYALVTLCRACHVKAHHTARPGFGFVTMTPMLWRLWRELHSRQPEQRLLLGSAVEDRDRQLGMFDHITHGAM